MLSLRNILDNGRFMILPLRMTALRTYILDDRQRRRYKSYHKAFEAKMPALYTADGQHRSAAAALVGAEKAKQNVNHQGK